MIQALVSSFGLVAASEMGDKTQLLAFYLSVHFRKPFPILFGILSATLLNHALATTLGQWLAQQISTQMLSLILAIFFAGFGVWTLIPDSLEAKQQNPRYGAFVTTLVLFFLAEMGDKTQLATVALAAHYQDAVTVTIGSTLGMMTSDGLAVFLGDRLSEKLPLRWIRRFTALLFLIMSGFCLFKAFS